MRFLQILVSQSIYDWHSIFELQYRSLEFCKDVVSGQ